MSALTFSMGFQFGSPAVKQGSDPRFAFRRDDAGMAALHAMNLNELLYQALFGELRDSRPAAE